MKTYASINAEIAQLQKQAEALRKSEVASVIAKIKEAIEAYGLKADDLGLGRAPKATRAGTVKQSKLIGKTVGVAKYRDPKTGKTWTGRGKPPAWIAGAKNRDPYLIDGQGAHPESAAPSKQAGKARRKARIATQVPSKKVTRKAGKVRAARTGRVPVKTPVVEIESGAASE